MAISRAAFFFFTTLFGLIVGKGRNNRKVRFRISRTLDLSELRKQPARREEGSNEVPDTEPTESVEKETGQKGQRKNSLYIQRTAVLMEI